MKYRGQILSKTTKRGLFHAADSFWQFRLFDSDTQSKDAVGRIAGKRADG